MSAYRLPRKLFEFGGKNSRENKENKEEYYKIKTHQDHGISFVKKKKKILRAARFRSDDISSYNILLL